MTAMIDPERVRTWEEIGANAWPSKSRSLFDGWVLGLGHAHHKRTNSVLPLYPGKLPLEEKIDRVKKFYQDHGLRPVFKISPAAQPPDLDAVLTKAGYDQVGVTSFRIRHLAGSPLDQAEGIDFDLARTTDEWAAWHRSFTGGGAEAIGSLQAQIESPCGEVCLGLLKENGACLAVGLAVMEGDWVGLFSLVVDPEQRRRGYGRILVQRLVRWSRLQGARWAFLQVEMDNDPAKALYADLGFEEQYRYWYRVG